MSGLIVQFAYDYTDEHRDKLRNYTDEQSLVKYLKRQNLVEQFAQYADKHGLKRRNLMIQRSHTLLEQYIMSRMVYNVSVTKFNQLIRQFPDSVVASMLHFVPREYLVENQGKTDMPSFKMS